jgi:hypothetical protein
MDTFVTVGEDIGPKRKRKSCICYELGKLFKKYILIFQTFWSNHCYSKIQNESYP